MAIDEDLLRAIDEAMVRVGEVNRSRFINTLISNAITEQLAGAGGYVFSLIITMYDHEFGDVERYVTDVQHEFRDIIRVVTHTHITERDCIEVIHAMGSYDRIQELTRRLTAIKRGIKYIKTINIPIPSTEQGDTAVNP